MKQNCCNISNTQKAYSNIAQKYHENRDVFDLSNFYNELKAHWQKAGKLLDLGCGAGDSISSYFANDNWEIYGYDFCEEMLSLAKKNNPKMQTFLCDLCDVKLPVKHYQMAISVYAMFHLPVKEQFSLMKKVYNSLDDNGIFFFTYGVDNANPEEEVETVSTFMDEELFYAQAKHSELKKYLQSIGFKIVSFEYKPIANENFLWCTLKK